MRRVPIWLSVVVGAVRGGLGAVLVDYATDRQAEGREPRAVAVDVVAFLLLAAFGGISVMAFSGRCCTDSLRDGVVAVVTAARGGAA